MFDTYRQRISDLYRDAPLNDPAAIAAWLALRDDTVQRYTLLRGQLQVELTDDSEPYPDAQAMLIDLDGGRLIVSRAHSTHPVWSVEENVAFRAVHDTLGHWPARSDFSWEGENAACAAHAPLMPLLARQALFTECIAQTAYTVTEGAFPEQKTVLLDTGFDLSDWTATTGGK